MAMTGDGTNDAPALAQANVGLAMNSGTTAAKEAANMVDLDSDPTKILEVVEIGKQLLITRGSLTTFSIANDIAKYFAIIPAMFKLAIPQLDVLNIMNLATPYSAILSALIFNAIIIPCLIPLAMKGVKYRPMSSGKMLARNMMIYGLGGVIAPFVGIKIIDVIIDSAADRARARAVILRRLMIMNEHENMVSPIICGRLFWSLWPCCCCADSCFPLCSAGLSAVIFPGQAKGSLVTADGDGRGRQKCGTGVYRGPTSCGAVLLRTTTILIMKRTQTATARWSSTTMTAVSLPA